MAKLNLKTLGDVQIGKGDCLTCTILLLMRFGKGKTHLGLGELDGIAVEKWVYFHNALTNHNAVESPEHAVVLPSLMLKSN